MEKSLAVVSALGEYLAFMSFQQSLRGTQMIKE